MTWIMAFVLAIPAFILLSSSMQKHQRSVFGAALQPYQSTLFRRIGHSLLFLCLIWCVISFRWDIGMVVFTGIATLAALISIWFMTFQPTVFKFLDRIARKSEGDGASS